MRAWSRPWGSGAIPDTLLLAEAATWHERLIDAPDRAVHQAFEAWRSTSEAHVRAYEKVQAARSVAAALAADPTILMLRHEAVTRAMFQRRPVRARRLVAMAVLALAGAPLAAFGISHWMQRPAERPVEEVFRTEVGQQANVTLPDGSRVTLDTASQLRVAFSDSERKVVLNGQGWFQLADSSRPFVIAAGNRILTAVAGTYDVRTDPGQLRVLAVSGSMAMRTGVGDAGASVAIRPNDLLTVRGRETTIRRSENLSTFTSWRDGLLQFDDVRLADAVEELNRYRRQHIRVSGAPAAALRISGSFRTAETSAFVDALTSGFPVRAAQDGPAGIVIAAR